MILIEEIDINCSLFTLQSFRQYKIIETGGADVGAHDLVQRRS